MFNIGQEYKKKDIYKILNVPKEKQRGAWDKGSHFYNDTFFIFANVGIAGRTEHDYPNRWIDDKFEWYGQTKSSMNQPQIKKLVSGKFTVYIFTREDNLAPFRYEGEGYVSLIEDTVPVKILWDVNLDNALKSLITNANANSFVEGSLKVIGVNRYERNVNARKECIKHFGYKCRICGFDFKETYGVLGENYIQVHHVTPISLIGEDYIVNPIKDLIPICPNCHAMIHLKNPTLTVEELKNIIVKNSFNV